MDAEATKRATAAAHVFYNPLVQAIFILALLLIGILLLLFVFLCVYRRMRIKQELAADADMLRSPNIWTRLP